MEPFIKYKHLLSIEALWAQLHLSEDDERDQAALSGQRQSSNTLLYIPLIFKS